MLSIAPIRDCQGPHGVRYYVDVVANSRDDYYAGRGEASGVWLGAGAAALGLSGAVEPAQYLAVMSGQTPEGVGRLLERTEGRKVLGWDLTFSAPKSASLLWALGDADVGRVIRQANDDAVLETVEWLEGEVARARRGHGGLILHDVEGLVGAAFCHRTSRAGDPQLHTHVVVANAVRSVEDHRWTGLDSRGLYAMQTAAGAVYQSALRAKLSSLGLRWAVRSDGLGEVADIDRRLLRFFSTQRQRIEAALAERDLSSARAAQVAAHRVRPAKDRGLASSADETLQALWRTRLQTIDLGGRKPRVDDVTGALGRDGHGPTSPAEAEQVLAVMAVATRPPEELRRPCGLLTRRASTVTRSQIIRAVATAVDLSPAEVAQLVDRLLCRREVVPVLAVSGKGTRSEARRYTTADLLALERALADHAAARQGQRSGAVPAAILDAVEAARPQLGGDQRAALRRLLGAGHGIEVLVGPAGCGKTFLLDAARDGWQRAGYRVIGASLAALAAGQLEAGAGIPATTLHRLLADLRRPEAGGLGSDTVVVIDEAAMVGSRMLYLLAGHAARSGAKLVLCGDHHQLPEIDAGGGFLLLAEQLDAVELTDNRRQQHSWERQALGELRDGSVAAAVSAYTAAGRITLGPTAEATREAMIDHWWAHLEAGVDTAQVLLVAPTRADAEDLGLRAQRRRLTVGELGPDVFNGPSGTLYVGDRVIATRNDRRLGVKNGDRGTIIGASTDGGIAVGFDNNSQVTLPAVYATDHLRQGYGLTAHRAQGLTVDYTLLLGTESLYRELGYSALSRGRHTNSIYLTGTIAPDDNDAADPIDNLVNRLFVSRAEQPATTALPQVANLGDPKEARAALVERAHLAAALAAHPPSGNQSSQTRWARSTWQTAQQRRADLEAAGAARAITSAKTAEHDALHVVADQARQVRVEAERREPNERDKLHRYRQLTAQLHQRERLLGQAARWQQPDWARQQLGSVPTSRTGEAAWLAAAGAIAAYENGGKLLATSSKVRRPTACSEQTGTPSVPSSKLDRTRHNNDMNSLPVETLGSYISRRQGRGDGVAPSDCRESEQFEIAMDHQAEMQSRTLTAPPAKPSAAERRRVKHDAQRQSPHHPKACTTVGDN